MSGKLCCLKFPARIGGVSMGREIRTARELIGMTREELADRVGVHPKSISNWERNATVPRNKLAILEQVLGVRLGEAPVDGSPTLREATDAQLLLEVSNRLAAARVQISAGGAYAGGLAPGVTGSRPSDNAEGDDGRQPSDDPATASSEQGELSGSLLANDPPTGPRVLGHPEKRRPARRVRAAGNDDQQLADDVARAKEAARKAQQQAAADDAHDPGGTRR